MSKFSNEWTLEDVVFDPSTIPAPQNGKVQEVIEQGTDEVEQKLKQIDV